MRFLESASKLRSVRLIQERFQKMLSYDQVLRMMDHLSDQEEIIKERFLKTAKKLFFPQNRLNRHGFEELLSHSLTIFLLFLLIPNCSEPLDTSPF